MHCRVIEDGGIRAVRLTPDLSSELSLSPRLLAAAVVASDRARRGIDDDGAFDC
jgi:hypothetical protein